MGNRLVDYKILLDNHILGSIENGETEICSIEPGFHTLKVKAGLILKSQDFQFSIQKDEVKELTIFN